MTDRQDAVFRKLFSQACEKCFGHEVTTGLSETDARLFSNVILQHTGLLLGVKSLKNYSIYVLDNGARKENPSIATLDTLARYILDAPVTDELKRKDHESHHPYWFQYKAANSQIDAQAVAGPPSSIATESIDDIPELPFEEPDPHRTKFVYWLGAIAVVMLIVVVSRGFFEGFSSFNESFNNVSADSLAKSAWEIQNPDSSHWKLRAARPGHLTLYTLIGDNWPGNNTIEPIHNLLVHKLESDCFALEVQFRDLKPDHNWQQAGILLSEDPSFRNRVIRLSFSYNDFFGGYSKQPEIIIQGLSSVSSSQFSKPEEFAHIPILTLEQGTDSLVWRNLRYAVLKVEKKGAMFRFLFSTGPTETFAFKEAVRAEFDFNPTFAGLFAIQGLATEKHVSPVYVDRFNITELNCGE
jgi:hypothetical protein